MLQRLSSFSNLDEELLPSDGLWLRSQLEKMNDRFVVAVMAAFDQGLESRAVAAATVRVSRNGSQRLTADAAIGAVWNWFVGVKFEATAVEVLARARVCCPKISAEQVREEFRRRLFSWVGLSLR